MQGWQFLFFLLLNLAIGVLVFIGRNWIKARIEQSVRSGFEARLEALRSDLRRSEEQLKSELHSKEVQISALRDGILSGRTQRQALLDKRRLEAIVDDRARKRLILARVLNLGKPTDGFPDIAGERHGASAGATRQVLAPKKPMRDPD